MRVYLDASALVKLIIQEPETEALRRHLSADAVLISSRLAAVEVRRVAARQSQHDAEEQVKSMLDTLSLVELDATIAWAAGTADPASLRSLDAIHLASAQSVASDISSVITYDLRLADAARAAGLTVVTPA